MLSHITDTLTTLITNLYVTTGLFGILLAMAIESCCIPLPSEIVMPLAGIMIASGRLLHGTNSTVSLLLVALVGALGCLIGSIAAYGIGYSGGRPLMLKYGRYLLISQHDADKADAFFQRWGSATAFFSRLLPVVRTYISLPAGISKMPFVKFCIYTFLGSFPWCIVLAFVGIQLGNHLDTLSPIFHSLDVVILVAVVILVVLYVWRHLNNDRKARAAALTQTGSQDLGQQNVPQSWQQQNTPFSQNQYQQPQNPQQGQYQQWVQNPQQGQYQQPPQVRQFQPPQQGNTPEWNQQTFPPQQNWPPASDDRTIRR